ncbi:MAG: peptidylprolyl isomerase [Clostridia bacterium]|nr:peptidylprolyl isomerase [Clostridia bacterium]
MDMQNTPADARKEKRNAILITIAVVVVAACIIGLVVYNNLADSGYFLRREVAAQSENFTVNGSMMTYYFYSNYNQYADMFTQMGVDTAYSLKSQYADEENGITWFDYMATLTQSYVGELLALCEIAKANGMELTADDQAYIDENIAAMEAAAKEYGYTLDTYLMAMFGAGVKADDVRDSMELSALSSKYYNEYYNGLTYSEEEYEAYYEANKTSFQAVDLITCTVRQNDFIETDENGNPIGNITEAAAQAKAYAESMAAAATEEEFRNAILAYNTDIVGLSAEEAEMVLAAAALDGMTATAGNTASDWAFSAKTGDTTVVDVSGGATYDVYYLTRAAYRDESPTRNVRHLLLSADTYGEEAETAAQTIYSEWEATGFDLTTFAALVYQFSEDTGSIATGGLYENVSQGDMVTEFDAWLFDSSRREGDTGIVNTTYGTHIMYYDGESGPAWRATADSALRTEDYSNLIADNSAGITFDSEVIYNINA